MNHRELEIKAREHDVSDASPEVLVEATEAATEGAATVYKKIEEGVVAGYKKIEDGVVEGFGKVVDKCVEVMFGREGESVEQTKARLTGEKEE